MNKILYLTVSLCACSPTGENPYLYSSPENALNSLERAYVNEDLNQAVASKDFVYEARMILENVNPELLETDLIEETAEVLELAFRKEIELFGFPELVEMECYSADVPISSTEALITKICKYSDNESSTQKFIAHKTNSVWKIASVIDKDA
ncbi:MAG: hypothetical protein AAF542_05440 [Pseudomonadota bacterium]